MCCLFQDGETKRLARTLPPLPTQQQLQARRLNGGSPAPLARSRCAPAKIVNGGADMRARASLSSQARSAASSTR